jgi:hypothetical protein
MAMLNPIQELPPAAALSHPHLPKDQELHS